MVRLTGYLGNFKSCLNPKERNLKMKKMTIKIYSIPDISTFVTKAIKVENNDITVKQGRYIIDGKSLMGVLSLDLTRKIIVEYPDTAFEFEDLNSAFANNAEKTEESRF